MKWSHETTLDTEFWEQSCMNKLFASDFLWVSPRENKGTERENQGVGWDMSTPLKLLCRAYFPLWILAQEIPFPFFCKVIFIDKTNLHAVRHFIAFAHNIRSRLTLMRKSLKTDFRSRNIAKNNFTGIDISQDLDAPLSVPLFSLGVTQVKCSLMF